MSNLGGPGDNIGRWTGHPHDPDTDDTGSDRASNEDIMADIEVEAAERGFVHGTREWDDFIEREAVKRCWPEDE